MFNFHFMSMGVLISINISQQHDEIDITPTQLCLNSLYYLALIMQKKVKYFINAGLKSHSLHSRDSRLTFFFKVITQLIIFTLQLCSN